MLIPLKNLFSTPVFLSIKGLFEVFQFLTSQQNTSRDYSKVTNDSDSG